MKNYKGFVSFEEDLIESLKDFEEAKHYLLTAVNDDDPDFLIDAVQLVIQAWGPTKISQLVGGSKQKWASLENPTFITLSHFLQAFELKLGAFDKNTA